jgi:hypothetical protein
MVFGAVILLVQAAAARLPGTMCVVPFLSRKVGLPFGRWCGGSIEGWGNMFAVRM